ncbi:MAG: hypothetical protein RLZZ498_227 [Pseudomonadota bacterium]
MRVFIGRNASITLRHTRLLKIQLMRMFLNPFCQFVQRVTVAALTVCGCMAVTPAQAQTFKMPCEVEGVIPALEDLKIKPEKATMEIQTMGKNIFLKLNGPGLYQVQVSSLTAEDFIGKNLTSAKEMGAYRKNKLTGVESEIRIEQATVMLSAYTDTVYQGKKVRLNITGPCTVPR